MTVKNILTGQKFFITTASASGLEKKQHSFTFLKYEYVFNQNACYIFMFCDKTKVLPN